MTAGGEWAAQELTAGRDWLVRELPTVGGPAWAEWWTTGWISELVDATADTAWDAFEAWEAWRHA